MGGKLFLLLLLCHVVWSTMVARCPKGWQHRGGSDQCFLIHHYGDIRKFSDARSYCKAHGGDLATIDTTTTRDWLALAVAETGDVGQNAYMWVGAKETTEDTWMWVETQCPVNHTILPWEGAGQGTCAAFTANSKLIKQDCDQRLKFICHRKINVPPPCDYEDDWEQLNGYCYKRSTEVHSWHDALVECNMEGASLISITGTLEQQWATDFATEAHDSVWTGLTEEGHPGSFEWIDGNKSNYSHWDEPDQPDMSLNGYGAAVVDIDKVSGSWVVEKVTQQFPYICKKSRGACVPGWESHGHSCYYFNTEPDDMVVWDDAKSTCEAVGASLVVLDDETEDRFFRNHMPETDTLWIGLFSVPEDQFYWTDNTTMASKNFTHVSDENEDAALHADDNRCVFLQTEAIGHDAPVSSWMPIDCKEPRHYACEIPAGETVHLISPSNERYCPEGWSNEFDHCYMFSEEEKTWTAAQRECQSHQAHLVSVATWAEQDYVFNHQGGGGWLGLNDRALEGSWVWSDGTSVTITNWNEGEPSGGDENCVGMIDSAGKWNDVRCEQERPFICKRKASDTPIYPVTTTTAKPDYSNCGWDWTENPVSGECYRLELQELTFRDAHLQCRELDHHHDDERPELISFTTAQEQDFIEKLVSEQQLSQSTLWIGMKNDIDGNRWLDGTPVGFFNWNFGEPNGVYVDYCVEMYTYGGKWNDVGCSQRRAFLCEKKGPNYVGPQPPPPPPVKCPDGWSYWNNHCYYLSTQYTDWDSAQGWCKENFGSQLVSITNKDENIFISGMLSSQNIWIGLHDDNNGHNWHWADGTQLSYSNWLNGEPNNANGNEHCGELRTEDMWYGHWNDISCSSQDPFVCKMTVKTCPESFTYHEGKCYYASNFDATWDAARYKCKQFNSEAELVSIHSDDENSFFHGKLTHSSPGTWLGLTYNSSSQVWSWSDGADGNYTNWNDGEPNDMESEWCAEIIDYSGKWNNLPCTQSRSFGCEFLPTHTVGCEDGWEAFDKYCYKHSNADHSYEMDTYDNTRAKCQGLGGDLVSIHTPEENDFVFSLLSIERFYTSTWIGMTDNGHPGDLTWSDGTSVTFTNWGVVYSYPFTHIPTCAQYAYTETQALWSMNKCEEVSYYICKKPQEARPINPPQDNCTEGDEAYKGSCYNFPGFPLSWNEAEANCEAQNSHLLVLNDRFESAYISAFLGNMGTRIWIGLSGTIDAGGSVTFSWVNHEAIDFTNWNEFEPDPTHGTCVAASGMITNPGLWTVRDCDDHFQFICEYDREGYTTPTMPSTKPPIVSCAEGWTHQGGRCYQVFQEPLSWGGGEQFCASFGAHLASVGSAVEQELIKELPGMHYVSDYYNSVWVGLKLGSESGYEWTDGTPFDYVDWAEGQPDSQYYRENCASANMDTFKLSDCVCDAHLPYVCEAEEGSMITTIAPPTVTPDVMCDDSTWYLYDNHCYKFISASDEEPQTWWESHRRCRDEGADLASIHSFEENYWIESKIFELSDNILWVGGRANVDSGYDWVDGSPFDFDNWAKGEPNNFMDQEDCIALYTHQQGYWNDQNCANKEGRVCKRLHGKTLPPVHTTKVPDGHCPQGWFHTGIKCLQLFTEKKNFSHARASCKQLGTDVDLASIHSPAEQAYLTAILGTMEVNVWLGLRYSQTFQWVDQSTLTYTNWASGEPNGALHGEDCVHAYFPNGEWNDIDCSNEYGYICMMLQDSDIVTQSPPPACEPPYDHYIRYNSACYRPDSNSKTWQEAETLCAGEGAHLVSALDMGESAMLWVLLQESGFTDAWIGLNNLQDVHIFKWSDDWPTTYTNWDIGQPNVSFSNHNCTRVSSTNGNWFTASCNESSPFICKFKNGTVPTPDPPITGKCPDSRWLDLGGSYCYLISDQKKPWNDASMNCVQESANLVSIHSEAEMELINMAINSIRDTLWIGLVQKKSGYGWSDHSAFNFVNWYDGEPNSNDEDCTEMYANSGQWNDADCSNARNFMCKTLKIHQSASTNPPPITMPATTHHPSGWKSSSLSAGGIIGIIIATLLVTSVIGYVGYSHVQKKPEPMRNGGTYSFDNALYSAKDDNSKVEVKRAQDTSLDFEADCGDTDA